MKKFPKILLSLVCAVLFLLPVCAGCAPEGGNGGGEGGDIEKVDYASQVQLDFSDPTSKKQHVKVRLFVDGDTTHFDPLDNVSDFAATQNFIKARYLGINTPESTGTVEKWGKTASLFVKEKLSDVDDIYVESNNTNWNIDSTGERYLLWIWYKPTGAESYRNLNIELLQEGFGRGSGITDSRYEEVALKALNQAQALKLHVFSPASTVDENYFDDPAAQVTLRELRFHPEQYLDRAVRVEGTVIARFGSSAYIEDYDEENGVSYGIGAFYGYNAGDLLDILQVGNRVSVRGKVSVYQGVYQLNDLKFNPYKPQDEENTFLLEGEDAPEIPFKVTEAADIVNWTGNVEAWFPVMGEDGEMTDEKFTIDSREAIMSTSVTVEHLKIISKYTTNTGGKSDGAVSITCEADDGTRIVIRTEVLKEADGTLITEDAYPDEAYITVKGIVDKFTNSKGETSYQVAVYKFDQFTFLDA